jgi:hypothetical protein
MSCGCKLFVTLGIGALFFTSFFDLGLLSGGIALNALHVFVDV